MQTRHNVVDLLLEQHIRIREMFGRVEASAGKDRQQAFDQLRRFLAVHETAEEMIVHPSARRHGAGDLVDARLAEEHDAKEVLSALDGMDVADSGFDVRLAALKDMVLTHAENEEREEFPLLLDEAGRVELDLMAKAVLAAERLAPTHPHAGLESMTANVVAGPIVSLVDRTRDAVNSVLHRRD